MVDPFVTNYCNMCLGKLFQYALEVFGVVHCLIICDRTEHNWQKSTILSIKDSLETFVCLI